MNAVEQNSPRFVVLLGALVAIEGVLGVLYVAVLIARTVGIYSRLPEEEEDE